jgi:hypothetical protein
LKREIDHLYLEHLVSTMSISDDPEYLALYIEEGGELNNYMRGFLAKLVRDKVPKKRGGPRPLDDLNYYQQVEAWLTSQENAPIYDHINENMSTITYLEAIKAFEEIPKNIRHFAEEAHRHFANELTVDGGTDIDEGTLRKRYERGRKIDKKRI